MSGVCSCVCVYDRTRACNDYIPRPLVNYTANRPLQWGGGTIVLPLVPSLSTQMTVFSCYISSALTILLHFYFLAKCDYVTFGLANAMANPSVCFL